MIKSDIIHPELIGILAKCGHKAQILIADANYSFVTNSNPQAKIIYLNFTKGLISSTDILHGVKQLINIEKATMMQWPEDFENTIKPDYAHLLGSDTPIELTNREDFYATVKSPDTLLVIASGETRRFANILLTVGPVII